MFSVEFCRKMVKEHEDALSFVLKGQSYSMNGRALTRVNYKEISDGLKMWQDRLEAAQNSAASGSYAGSTIRCRRVIFHG